MAMLTMMTAMEQPDNTPTNDNEHHQDGNPANQNQEISNAEEQPLEHNDTGHQAPMYPESTWLYIYDSN
eukprot:11416957-Prorocentrum_lima.AAC.1